MQSQICVANYESPRKTRIFIALTNRSACLIPYIRQNNLTVLKDICQLSCNQCPELKVPITQSNKHTIVEFFKHKDDSKSSVFVCYNTSMFVRAPTPSMFDPMSDILNLVGRTRQPLHTPSISLVRDYPHQKYHLLVTKRFIIIIYYNQKGQRTLESLYIYQLKPDLNNSQQSAFLCHQITMFIVLYFLYFSYFLYNLFSLYCYFVLFDVILQVLIQFVFSFCQYGGAIYNDFHCHIYCFLFFWC